MRTRGLAGRRRTALLSVLTLVGAALVTVAAAGTASADPCAPLVNEIACENAKPGALPSEWDVSGAGSPSIQGFTTDISVDVGGTVVLKVDTDARSYRVDVYRLGYYAGRGARKIATVTPSATLPQVQPSCLTKASTGLVDCGNWAPSASWTVPVGTVSGVFLGKLVRTDGTAGASHVPFVVRSDASTSDLLVQTSDTTWHAYNQYGGNSLYTGSPAGRSYEVSYNRPITTRGTGFEDALFNAEFPMIRFLEANGYDVSYSSGVDTARRGELLKRHRTFVSVGHDEYWSGTQRVNVEAARDAGVNLAFFSGNEVFWKTRWESGAGGSTLNPRTMVCYKETKADAKIDPSAEWTGTWRDPRFSPPADGGRPENALTGTMFMVNGGPTRKDSIKVPPADGKMRFWRGTSVATATTTTTMPAGTLGYEWDADLDNASRPAGLVRLSTATYAISGDLLLDQGYTYGSGSTTHALTLYRTPRTTAAPNGALVFGAGTVQWSWGLDATHDSTGTATSTSPAMRQATVNLLADMGAQPGTIVSGLTAAAQSTDATPPSSKITSPAAGASVTGGTAVTITGTATDVGGRVGGVEVSVDGGSTWRRADGRESWTYRWTPNGSASVTLKSRAADDSGNLETPSAGVTVGSGTPPPVTCPCTVFGTRVPQVAAENDTAAVELGVKVRSTQSGTVTGIRFYKGTGNTGTHTGSLWTSAGTRLATGTFGGETATGWQSLSFSSPVPVSAGATYVASYYAPVGRYAADQAFFGSATSSGPLTALADGTDGANGVYRYGAGGGFPTSTFKATNYWVDLVFSPGSAPADTTPPSVVSRAPAQGATGVATTTRVTAGFSEPVTPALSFTLTDGTAAVASSFVLDQSRTTATLTPTNALAEGRTYTTTLSGATDDAGNTAAAVTWTFTTTTTAPPPPPPPQPGCPCSLWSTTTTPSVTADPDTASVEVGVKVLPNQAGSVTAIRFYKGAGNTGTHVVHLWSAAGALLATATASGETATGWQTVPLASPVAVTAGTTYVASYRATVGRYSVDEGYFTGAARTSGPLTAPASTAASGNGVYTYAAGTTFPSSTYKGSNYWVDVVFS